MIITLNIIEAENVVWISDDDNPIGVEFPCSNKSELRQAAISYIENFIEECR